MTFLLVDQKDFHYQFVQNAPYGGSCVNIHGYIGLEQMNKNVEQKKSKGEVAFSYRNKIMLSIKGRELLIFDTTTTI